MVILRFQSGRFSIEFRSSGGHHSSVQAFKRGFVNKILSCKYKFFCFRSHTSFVSCVAIDGADESIAISLYHLLAYIYIYGVT